MKKIYSLIFTLVFLYSNIFSWGGVAHTLINRNTTKYFPIAMQSYKVWSEYLALHASDADYRKGDDPDEYNRHFIDIDNFQEFFTQSMPYSLDSLIAKYGIDFVNKQGILPWAIQRTYDSLKIYLQVGSWDNAKRIAADLGHYVGDLHMPLHLTRNYDGQFSNQKGIHSRYETQMLNTFQTQIYFTDDSIGNISSPISYIFEKIYSNYKYLDTVLKADSIAKSIAGSYNTEYYNHLWNRTKNATILLLNDASRVLASLIYSAFIEAGSPVYQPTEVALIHKPNSFTLYQNYPNPFNFSTIIRYYISPELAGKKGTLQIVDSLGKTIITLFEEELKEGEQQFEFDAKYYKLSSGVYFYKLTVDNREEIKKMQLIK